KRGASSGTDAGDACVAVRGADGFAAEGAGRSAFPMMPNWKMPKARSPRMAQPTRFEFCFFLAIHTHLFTRPYCGKPLNRWRMAGVSTSREPGLRTAPDLVMLGH